MRVVFMGSPDFAVPSLRALLAAHEVCLVVTQPDKPAGRGKRLTPPAVKVLAEGAGVPIYQPRSARAPEVAERLRAEEADIGVVVAYGKILPAAVLEAFPRGCVNVHGSLLPRHRGAAPIQHAVIAGDEVTGVTIMRLDEGMDTGPMLLTREEPIRPEDTAGTLFARLAELGAEALIEALALLERGALTETPQDEARATMAPMLAKEDGRIDWAQPARRVADRIRGVDPWPGATTLHRGERLKLFGARLAGGTGRPGEVLAVDERGLVVACGEGACAIAEVQAPGRRRVAARDFARGRELGAGTLLGAS